MLVAIATLPVSLRAQEIPIYRDASKPIEERIDDALSRMTLEEKVGLLHADRSYGSAGVPRLGIPENNLSDGPSGLRPEMVWQTWIHAGMSSDSCTAFPALVCLAATWNPEMGHLFGKSLGEEALYRDKNMLLGPAVNIFRTPMNGRNFEYMGEDPYLTSKMAVSYIKGVQENHVSACVKHFAVNNQETKRTTINTIVDERTLHEIYFPAFKAAVQEAGVWAVMGVAKSVTFISLVTPILVLGIPIFDTFFAIIRRSIKHQPIFKPDKEHLHHCLLNMGLSHRNTVLVIYGINIVLAASGLLISYVTTTQAMVLLVIISTAVLVGARKLGIIGFKTPAVNNKNIPDETNKK